MPCFSDIGFLIKFNRCMKKNKANQDLFNLKSLLIIRLSSLGEILLTTPLLRSIKKQYPHLKISFLVKKQYEDALKLNPHITELFLYEPQKEKLADVIQVLKKKKFDLVLDLQNNFRSKQIINVIDAETFKFDKRSVDKFLLVNFKINRLEDAPPIPERYALTLPGLKLDREGLELHTKNSISLLLNEKEKLIGMAPGARHFTKRWPKEYFVYLGKLLLKAGYITVLFGGKDDIQLCGEISRNIKDSINLCNSDELLQTAADMKKCRAVVSNDSGLMHTACAMKIPVLVFFGSTVKEFGFTPYNERNLILENNSLTCRPCSHIGRERCPKGHFRCLLDISPEKAFEVLMTLVEKQ